MIATGELTMALIPRGGASDSGLRFREVFDPRAAAVRLEALIAGTSGHDEAATWWPSGWWRRRPRRRATWRRSSPSR
ncbi:MAG: hypothetical protein M5U28_04895 [Sandaracinaceae bacterium]|nr:hypothetical protein [Sandaracinaceae bacterium]